MINFKIVDGTNEIAFDNIADPVGFEYPEINAIFSDIPGKNGVFYVKSDYDRRSLSWKGAFSTNGPTNRRTILAITVGALKTLKFETCDGLELQTDVEIIRVNMPYRRGRSTYLFEAVAPDHRFFDQTLISLDTAPTTATGGVTLPTELPIDFSNVTGVPNLTLTNNGDSPTPPIFTITGPGTNFTIQNVTTSEVLQINTTITLNDEIVINVKDKTVILNGDTNTFGTKSGTFWEVPVGTSELHFVPQTGEGATTNLNVQYREAYKGA